MRKALLSFACLLFVAFLAPLANANTYSAIYSFGDSLSDVGDVFIGTSGEEPAAPYSAGQFSNGPVWVQDLAVSLGLPPTAPSLVGGNNYAYGGAVSGPATFNTGTPVPTLIQQTAQFTTAHPSANPTALYTIWAGANDLTNILSIGPTLTPAQAATDLGIVVGNIDAAVINLANHGATNFLVLDVPNLGLTPEIQADGPMVAAEATALSADFDSLLISSLNSLAAGAGINISTLDTYSLLDEIAAFPSLFGFTDVTDPCYTGTVLGFADLSDPGTVCPNPNQYLFWDDIHPTAAADAFIANAALTSLTPEPSSLLLLGTGFAGILAFLARKH